MSDPSSQLRVPFVDLGRQHEPLIAEIESAVAEVFARGDFILGAAVDRFESEFGAYVGTEHAVGVSSGTAALSIALRSCGIGPGDGVVVPAHTYIASALAVLHVGATPIFCDVDPLTGLIDYRSAEAVAGDARALIVVHLYGQVADLDAARRLAEKCELRLIEDAAQAHGARWQGRPAGSAGDASAFSFYPSKNLGAFGDGGMICTDDEEIAEAARTWRNLGQREKGEHLEPGYNERLDTVQAAVLGCKLPHLDAWNADRRRIAGRYEDRLRGAVQLLPDRPGDEGVFHLFPVRVGDRDAVLERLRSAGIDAGVHYSPAVHLQPPFLRDGSTGSHPEAEAWAREEISLPIFPGMTEDEVDAVSGALRDAVGAG